MEFDVTTAVGLAAATMTTAAFLPQAVKTWRTRQTRDISLATFTVLCLGIILWLAYGFLKQDLPLLIGNGITLILAATILVLKLKYK